MFLDDPVVAKIMFQLMSVNNVLMAFGDPLTLVVEVSY